MRPFFLGRRWINNQRNSNSVWYNTLHWKKVALICCAQRSPKVTLITVFVSIVAWKQAQWPPLFYYVFNISLSCNINIPSFIGNLWWDLLLGNHLKLTQKLITQVSKWPEDRAHLFFPRGHDLSQLNRGPEFPISVVLVNSCICEWTWSELALIVNLCPFYTSIDD